MLWARKQGQLSLLGIPLQNQGVGHSYDYLRAWMELDVFPAHSCGCFQISGPKWLLTRDQRVFYVASPTLQLVSRSPAPPPQQGSEKKRTRQNLVFCNLILKVTCYHFYPILTARHKSWSLAHTPLYIRENPALERLAGKDLDRSHRAGQGWCLLEGHWNSDVAGGGGARRESRCRGRNSDKEDFHSWILPALFELF